jgi:hypothetical protein
MQPAEQGCPLQRKASRTPQDKALAGELIFKLTRIGIAKHLSSSGNPLDL